MHANRWVGLGVGALALFFGAGLPFVDSQGGYAGLSPRFLPTLVTIGLALCSLVLLARPASVPAHADDADTMVRPELSFHRLGWVAGGLIAHMIVIGTIGFVLASSLLMVCVARGFGSTRPVRDAGIALAIAFPMWLLFAKVLQVSLKLFPLAGFLIMTDTLMQLAGGFAAALTAINLVWALAGCFLGTAIGVLPGIGPALTVAMLLPLTAKVEPASALILFSGIYYGAMFGGSTTSILMNTPGESATMVTAMEGNTMAKNGRAGPALATAAIGSFVAGTIATVLLSFVAPAAAQFALRFGPAEYFMIMVLAFTTVSAVLGSSVVRGMTSLFIGLGIGLIGIEATSGQTRYSLGIPELYDGLDIVVVAVGLFAVGEALYNVFYLQPDASINRMSQVKMNAQDWRRSIPAWLRGSALGFPFGLIPAGGAEIPTFLSYATEKRLSKHPEDFATNGGPGAIEGVAGPEAANNATVTAALAPLLTLGIPVSSTTAILLAAFQNYNLQPGPTLMQTSGTLVWTLIASLYIGNVMLLVLNLPLVGMWVRILRIPTPLLYGGILIFSTMGAYSLRQSWFDLLLLLIIGLLGLAMRRYGFPTAPVIVGMILGPMAEKQLRNALSISQGDWSVFATRPICLVLLVVIVCILVLPRLLRKKVPLAG